LEGLRQRNGSQGSSLDPEGPYARMLQNTSGGKDEHTYGWDGFFARGDGS
jgi:hypothetical protein